MTKDEMIACINALFDGTGVVQEKANYDGSWDDMKLDEQFDFSNFEYRIKEEPKEVWILNNGDTYLSISWGSYEEALKGSLVDNDVWKPVKFREVIE